VVERADPREGAFRNSTAGSYASISTCGLPDLHNKVSFETLFTRVSPFYHAMILYVLDLPLDLFLVAGRHAHAAAHRVLVLVVTLAFHTLGLVSRISFRVARR